MACIIWIAFLFGLAATFVANGSKCNIHRQLIYKDSVDILSSLPDIPVIYSFPDTAKNEELLELTSKSYLMENYRNDEVTLSSSNGYSHDKRKFTLGQYIASFNSPEDTSGGIKDSSSVRAINNANETFYLFGNNYGGIWKQISTSYDIPNCQHCDVVGAKTVGIGSAESGVSFHFHGPGFAEVLHGSKQWFFFPSHVKIEDIPYFYPNSSMVDWTMLPEVISRLGPRAHCQQHQCRSDADLDIDGDDFIHVSDIFSEMQECVLLPGELLYFPVGWLHGTLNLDEYNVFISTFVDMQLAPK